MAEIWGAALVVAGTVYSANKQAGAAQDAGQAGVDASNQSNAVNMAMFNQQRADQLPAMVNGQLAQTQFMRMMGFDMTPPTNSPQDMAKYLQANPDVAADPYWSKHAWEHFTQHGKAEGRQWGTPAAYNPALQQQAQQQAYAQMRNSPGYQFQFQEGQRALETGANANGQLFSGKTGKALTQYGQNYADRTFGDYMNRLASVSGMGQTATSQAGQAAQNYGNQFGQNAQAAGQARASGIIGGANATSNAVNSLTTFAGNYYGQRK